MDQVTLGVQLSYHGAPFSGFAKQPGDVPTVQGELEAALHTLFRQEVSTVCAGRTDAGVHARDQWVSFQVPRDAYEAKGDAALRRSLDALTSLDISIVKVERKPDGFSARFDARTREYRYFVATTEHCPVLLRQVCWHVRHPLDVEAMQEACTHLVGEHDFKSFCMQASAEGKNTVRTVLELSVEPVEVLGEPLLCIRVVGNAFLHSMVRTMVGTLVLVGRGKRNPEWVAEVLEARSRGTAGEKAPACGLVFWHVDYDNTEYMSATERREKERLESEARTGLPGGEAQGVCEDSPDKGIAEAEDPSALEVFAGADVEDPDNSQRLEMDVEKQSTVEVGSAEQLPSEHDGFVEAARIRDEEMPAIMDGLDLSGFDEVLARLTREADEALNRGTRITDPTDAPPSSRRGKASSRADRAVREGKAESARSLKSKGTGFDVADPAAAEGEDSLVVERRMGSGVPHAEKKRKGLRDFFGRASKFDEK